jgi:hypothetical protein
VVHLWRYAWLAWYLKSRIFRCEKYATVLIFILTASRFGIEVRGGRVRCGSLGCGEGLFCLWRWAWKLLGVGFALAAEIDDLSSG